jgi:hypothetical protein
MFVIFLFIINTDILKIRDILKIIDILKITDILKS